MMEVLAFPISCAFEANLIPIALQVHQKRNWFLTYNSPTALDERMMMDEGLEADEVVYTKDRALSYLYFHLERKVRQTTIESFISAVGLKFGVRVNEMFGFDAVSSSIQENGIHCHPGFWTLMKHEKDKNNDFKVWIKDRLDPRKGYMLLKKLASSELASVGAHADPGTSSTGETKSDKKV